MQIGRLQDHAKTVQNRLVEIAGQKFAAEKELEAVKVMAGASVSEVVCNNFATFVQHELAQRSMQEQQVATLMQATWERMQLGAMLPQAAQQAPASAAAQVAPQVHQSAAAATPASAGTSR
jgi:hypothetical protein